MSKSIKLFFFIIALAIGQTLWAGLYEIAGVYRGKSLFIENKFMGSLNEHCLTNIYVNDAHLVDHPRESVVELNLSGFEIGQKLVIRVYHKSTCKPIVLNPQDIKDPKQFFDFTTLRATESEIHWETQGEESICKYSLQQKVNGDWRDVKFVKGQGLLSANTYTLPSSHASGTNVYRIKYRASGGVSHLSQEISYESSNGAVYFYPKRVADFITFETNDNRSIDYKVTDIQGNEIFSGAGIIIDCRNLVPGNYYVLKYDNKEGKFYKKENDSEVNGLKN